MYYFNISTGLRGCYMADNAYIVQAATLAELRDAITSEARDYRDAGFVGASVRAIAIVVRDAWNARDKGSQLPYALPLAPSHARDNYCHGIFIANATALECDEANEDYPDSESELSEQFDIEIAPLVIEQYGADDEPAMNEAFNNWTDSQCRDGALGDAQYDSYCYVGKYA